MNGTDFKPLTILATAKHFKEKILDVLGSGGVVQIRNDENKDAGRYHVEFTVNSLFIYQVLDVGLLYIVVVKDIENGVVQLYGDNQTVCEAQAVKILEELIRDADDVVASFSAPV